jgi:hypothetical protein
MNAIGILSLFQAIAEHLPIKRICMIDPFARLMDPTPLLPFLKKMTQTLYVRCGIVLEFTDGRRHYRVPKYIPMRLERTGKRKERNFMLYNNDKSRSINIFITNMQVKHMPLEVLKNMQMPFDKKSLTIIFDRLVGDATNHDYLRFLCEANFFRDMFHADVALQDDCAFVTQDRIAFVAYSIFAHHLGLPNRGLFSMEWRPKEWTVMFYSPTNGQ